MVDRELEIQDGDCFLCDIFFVIYAARLSLKLGAWKSTIKSTLAWRVKIVHIVQRLSQINRILRNINSWNTQSGRSGDGWKIWNLKGSLGTGVASINFVILDESLSWKLLQWMSQIFQVWLTPKVSHETAWHKGRQTDENF